MGVGPTIRSAKERITGFEGRESHRTLFASSSTVTSQQRAEDSVGSSLAFNIAVISLKFSNATQTRTGIAWCVRISAATRSCSAGLVHTS